MRDLRFYMHYLCTEEEEALHFTPGRPPEIRTATGLAALPLPKVTLNEILGFIQEAWRHLDMNPQDSKVVAEGEVVVGIQHHEFGSYLLNIFKTGSSTRLILKYRGVPECTVPVEYFGDPETIQEDWQNPPKNPDGGAPVPAPRLTGPPPRAFGAAKTLPPEGVEDINLAAV